MHKKQQIGKFGEELAEKFLIKDGYKILSKRFQTRFSEIDIIAEKDDIISFVEVKTRTNSFSGSPESSIDKRKVDKITMAAKMYVYSHNIDDKDFSIDCIAVELNLKDRCAKIRHYKNIS